MYLCIINIEASETLIFTYFFEYVADFIAYVLLMRPIFNTRFGKWHLPFNMEFENY